MKSKLFILTFAIISITTSVYASFNPIERISRYAVVVEKDVDGHELGIGNDKKLFEFLSRRSKKVTSFTFSEIQPVYCVVAPCHPIKKTNQFTVTDITQDKCGSTYYQAEIRQNPPTPSPFPAQTLEVVDHTTRSCDDYKPYGWEAEIRSYSGTGIHSRYFFGNPKSIFNR